MAHHLNRGSGVKYMLAGGSIVIAIGLMADLNGVMPTTPPPRESCQQIISEKSFLSRNQLSQFLAVPEGSSKSQVQAVMNEPYCQLADLQVRPGVTARRAAYPLAFDPKTWLVVLYEGESYAGYSFSFQR